MYTIGLSKEVEMGKKKGYDLPETDPVQKDGVNNEGTIIFTKQDYDGILQKIREFCHQFLISYRYFF